MLLLHREDILVAEETGHFSVIKGVGTDGGCYLSSLELRPLWEELLSGEFPISINQFSRFLLRAGGSRGPTVPGHQ